MAPVSVRAHGGRKAALALALPAVLCLVLAGWFFRFSILEEWYLLRLGSSDARAGDQAAEELARLRSLRAIPRLLDSLERNPARLMPLVRIGPPALAALIERLGEEPPPPLRPTILRWLIDLGPEEKQLLAPSLSGAWHLWKKPESQVLALKLMMQMALDEEAVLPVLKAALSSPWAEVRSTAALAAAGLSPERAKGVVPALVGLLGDPEEAVRSSAVSGLGNLGFAAAGALPALIEALGDPSEDARSMAALALARVGAGPSSDVAAGALLGFLCERVWEGLDCLSAAQALGELGPSAGSAEPLLRQMTATAEDPHLRSAAARALRRIAGDSSE
jgi:HEAT repeat protein